MKTILTYLAFFLFCINGFTQVREGDVELYLNYIIENLPGSSGNNYQEPTNNELDIWSDILDEIFSNNIELANNLAGSVNYEVVEFFDTTLTSNNKFYIIEEKLPQIKYWGTYVINSDPLRNNLIIQAPHPKYDTNTGYQAVFCFKRLKAKALFISGTHRCNNSQYSICSGTTEACNDVSAPYRISDNAHNIQSVFQKITERFYDQSDNSVFVQLHGFVKSSDDPYVIMSNGTRLTPTIDYNTLIKEGLLQEDPSLTFKIANINSDWDKLIAFSNTQGRYINKSQDPCTQNATATDGRFVHIEQEKSKLRQDSVWYKMYEALKYAFKIDTSSTVNVEDLKYKNNVEIYPNPAKDNIYIYLIDANIDKIQIFDARGVVMKQIDVHGTSVKISVLDLTEGLYILRFKTKDNRAFSKKIIVDN